MQWAKVETYIINRRYKVISAKVVVIFYQSAVPAASSALPIVRAGILKTTRSLSKT